MGSQVYTWKSFTFEPVVWCGWPLLIKCRILVKLSYRLGLDFRGWQMCCLYRKGNQCIIFLILLLLIRSVDMRMALNANFQLLAYAEDIALIASRLPDLKEFFIKLERAAKEGGLEVNEEKVSQWLIDLCHLAVRWISMIWVLLDHHKLKVYVPKSFATWKSSNSKSTKSHPKVHYPLIFLQNARISFPRNLTELELCGPQNYQYFSLAIFFYGFYEQSEPSNIFNQIFFGFISWMFCQKKSWN